MRPPLDQIALDSNTLSYVIDALEGVEEPKDGLAEQKMALVRIYLYTPGTLWTLPTVKREFERITDPVRRQKHESWTNVLFGVYRLNDPGGVEARAAALRELHGDEDDRLVLAEAEDIRSTVLLSFDARFVGRLQDHARLLLTTPADYWRSIAVPRGAPPDKIPRPENPLATQAWWRW